jgi:hypothetical protein
MRYSKDYLMTRQRHRLDQNAIDGGLGMCRFGGRHHLLIRIANARVADDVQRNGAGLGLVDDVGRLNLEGDGCADFGCGNCRLLGTRHQCLGRARHTVACQ